MYEVYCFGLAKTRIDEIPPSEMDVHMFPLLLVLHAFFIFSYQISYSFIYSLIQQPLLRPGILIKAGGTSHFCRHPQLC